MTFRDCVFRDMNAGVSTGAGVAANGDVWIEGCEFVNCIGSTLGGGAIYHSNGRLELVSSTVRQCGSRGVELDGASVVESALVENCLFVENWAAGSGGALAVLDYVNGVVIRGCRFERNVAHGTGGGALVVGNYGPKLIENCLFVDNWTDGNNGQGGAVSVTGDPFATITGCTFSGNHQTYLGLGGAAIDFYTNASLTNCVVEGSYGNTAVHVVPGYTVTTGCNVFWDNADGIGIPLATTDIVADPYFCAPDTGDFTLQRGSPCLPDSSHGCGQIGAFGMGCEPISVDPTSWGKTKNLYRERTKP
jgi:hypothetical protein